MVEEWKSSTTAVLTNIGPLWYTACVNFFAELRLVIVDIMEFDGKLSLWLQLLTCLLVDNCGFEDVKRLLLTIQALDGMQVTIILINDKDAAGTVTRQNILNQTVAMVLV